MMPYIRAYTNPKVMIMTILGFSSGLPLLLTSSTLALWLKKSGVNYTHIGLLSLTALPYTLKFIWAPFIDAFHIPLLAKYLGHRRSWLLISQAILLFLLCFIATFNPQTHLLHIALIALLIAFFSATQDTIILAYQTEYLGPHQYGAGEAMTIFGYRLGMLTAGAGALYLSSWVSWQEVYYAMGGLMVLGILMTCSMKDSSAPTFLRDMLKKQLSWQEKITTLLVFPLRDFLNKNSWGLCLLLMFLYKVSDNIIGSLHNIFYLDLGFTEIQIANASKIFGTSANIIGGFIGGFMVLRYGLIKSMFYGTIFHALAILCYLPLLKHDQNLESLYICIGLEHVTNGMRLTSFFAYQLTLATSSLAATQLAIFTSITHFGRIFFSSFSGWIVDHLGWDYLFLTSVFASVPVLIIIYHLSMREQGHIWPSIPLFLKRLNRGNIN